MSDKNTVESWEAFRQHGLLWLLNAVVFHPRGYALAFHYPETAPLEAVQAHEVEPIGWSLLGDGSEPWAYDSTTDEPFRAVEALLAKRAAI